MITIIIISNNRILFNPCHHSHAKEDRFMVVVPFGISSDTEHCVISGVI